MAIKRNKIEYDHDLGGSFISKKIKAAEKYKIDRNDAWYRYQVYAPELEKMADDLGYVHFKDSKTMIEFGKRRLDWYRETCKQEPLFNLAKPTSILEWFLCGMWCAGAIFCLAYWIWRIL